MTHGIEDVRAQAETLAKTLAEHPRTLALREAQKALAAAPADADLQKRYYETARKVGELEEAGKPLEPALKRKMAALADQVRRSPVLPALLRAHAEFAQLMETVSGTLSEAVDRALELPKA